MKVIDIKEKFELFDEHWSPRIIGQLNGQAVKIAKVKGAFVWHDHKDEDELFYVVKGSLTIEMESETVVLEAGQMFIVPKGVSHKPYAEEECWIMLFEPMDTKHTGEVKDKLTNNDQDWI